MFRKGHCLVPKPGNTGEVGYVNLSFRVFG
jgi:hypothetical protein